MSCVMEGFLEWPVIGSKLIALAGLSFEAAGQRAAIWYDETICKMFSYTLDAELEIPL